jgi:hypothetical protein
MKRLLQFLIKIYPVCLFFCLLLASFFDIWILAMLAWTEGKNIFVAILTLLALMGTIGLVFGLVKRSSESYGVIAATFLSCCLFPTLAIWIAKTQATTLRPPDGPSLGELLFFGVFLLQLALFIPKLLQKKLGERNVSHTNFPPERDFQR